MQVFVFLLQKGYPSQGFLLRLISQNHVAWQPQLEGGLREQVFSNYLYGKGKQEEEIGNYSWVSQLIVFAKYPLPQPFLAFYVEIFQSQHKYNLLKKVPSHPSDPAESVKNSFPLQRLAHQSQSSLVDYKPSSTGETPSLIFLMFSIRPGIHIRFVVLACLTSIRSYGVMPSTSSIRE